MKVIWLRRLLTKEWFRLAGAVVLSSLALLLSLLLWPITKPFSTPFFLMAIILNSWIFGFRAGVLSSILCAIAVDYFFVAPVFELVGDRDNLIRYAVFISEGTLISWIVDSRRAMVQKIRSSEEHLRALSLRQHVAREAERKRIAREIHDELGQVLTGLKMDVYSLKTRVKVSGNGEDIDDISLKLENLSKVVDSSIASVRRIATDLRPPVLDDLGLIAAMEWQAKEFGLKAGVECVFTSSMENIEIDSQSATAIFRIFQEALTNIARHADASYVFAEIEVVNGAVLMQVKDNGKGFDEAELETGNSLGILGMKERARLIGAEISFITGPGEGVILELKVPGVSKKD